MLDEHSNHAMPIERGVLLPGRPAIRQLAGVVQLVEGRVLVLQIDHHGGPADSGGRHGLALGAHDAARRRGLDLDVLHRLGAARRAAGLRRAVEPREPALADLLLDPHLPAQVAEVADQADVDETVRPPHHGQHEPGDDGGHHDDQQQTEHDPLPEGVLGARGDLRGLGVEPTAARPVRAGGALLGDRLAPGLGVALRLRLRLRLVELVVEVLVVVGVDQVLVLVGQLVGWHRVSGHGELLPPLAARTPAPHDPGGQGRIGGLRYFLALTRDHGNEDDKPGRGERHDDQRAGHLPSPPPTTALRRRGTARPRSSQVAAPLPFSL
ncbi:hypothetical protein FHX69_7051 [Prauserella muralis]|nr:hypothetical protein FHX69_7051 [Prauserella muralis]